MTINPDTAMPKVVDYLKSKEGIFYRARQIAKFAGFTKEDGVAPHGLAISLGNTIMWPDTIHYKTLKPITQLELWRPSGNSQLGVYYGFDPTRDKKNYRVVLLPEGEEHKRELKFQIYDTDIEKEVRVVRMIDQ